MSVIDRLRTAVRNSTPSYVCRYCRLSFDAPRQNCPACGCEIVESDR